MKNAFYIILKDLFALKFLSWLFDDFEKRLDQKNKVNFKLYDVTTWLTNNCNTYIVQYLTKKTTRQKLGQLIEYIKKNVFLQKLFRK